MLSFSAAIVTFLVHSVWLGGLLLLVVWFALYLIPKRFSALRACVCSSAVYALIPLTILFSSNTMNLIGPQNIESATLLEKPAFIQFVFCCWLAGCLISLCKVYRDWIEALSVVKSAYLPSTKKVTKVFENLLEKSNLAGRVRLLMSERLHQPSVLGVLKATILLPPSCLTGLTLLEIEAILAHELAHVKRWDFVHVMVETLIKAVLFFNPFVYGLMRFSAIEREAACDAYALTLIERPENMATGLLKLSLQEQRNAVLLSIFGGSLSGQIKDRVERIVGYRLPAKRKPQAQASLPFRYALIVFSVPVLAFYLYLQQPASNFDQLRLVSMKDEVCAILKKHNLYWHPKYASYGESVVHRENDTIYMNGAALPPSVSASIEQVFAAYDVDQSKLTHLRYYRERVELTLQPKSSEWVHRYSILPSSTGFTYEKVRA